MDFSAKRTISLSWLPLTRELPSIREAEGEKNYPSGTCGDSSPDKGSQERGKALYVPICHIFHRGSPVYSSSAAEYKWYHSYNILIT